MLLERLPDPLVDSLLEKRLVLFAGAGISLESGLPSGATLATELSSALVKNGFLDQDAVSRLSLAEVAQAYETAFGRQRLTEYLITRIASEGNAPNESHRMSVRLFEQIITTNYDSLFELALQHEGRSATVVVRDVNLPYTSIPDRTVVFKLHGDFTAPERLVITNRDYTRVPLSPGLENALRHFLINKNILFVGYGIRDSDFLRQLDFCRSLVKDLPKSYAVMPNVDSDQLFVQQCAADGIDVFSTNAKDFLADLGARAAQRSNERKTKAGAINKSATADLEVRYKTRLADEFRYIEFQGIPVFDNFLRVEIEKLYVALSASPSAGDGPSAEDKSETSKSSEKPAQAFKEIARSVEVFDLLRTNKKVVILGDPGSGKTTLLRFIAHELCKLEPDLQKIGLDKAFVPIFIPLREFAGYLQDKPQGTIESFLPELLEPYKLEDFLPALPAVLKDGRGIFLMDGLDEVATHEERQKIGEKVCKFSENYRECRLILTSRRVGYVQPPFDGPALAHFMVRPFTKSEIHNFVDLWCKATDTSDTEKQGLLEAIANPRVLSLAENPLLITILGRVYKSHRNLPERRAELYKKCLEALLTTRDITRELPPVFEDAREATRVMAPVAMWIQRDLNGQLVTKEDLIRKLSEIPDLPAKHKPKQLIDQVETRSGLLRQVGLNQYAFSHLTFQEYYVARDVISRNKPFQELRKFLRNDRWQEVIILTAGLLDELGQGPLTSFMNGLVVDPFPVPPSLLQLAKLNLLLGCLKDKAEPSKEIFNYAHGTLLRIVNKSNGSQHQKIMSKLPSLKGLSKTSFGAEIVEELKVFFSADVETPATNASVMAYRMLKDEHEQVALLLDFIRAVNPKFNIIASAAWAVASAVDGSSDKAWRDAVLNQIRDISEHRRQQILGIAKYALESEYLVTVQKMWVGTRKNKA